MRGNKIEIEKRFNVRANRSDKILNWGNENNYPQYIESIIARSGRLTDAIKTYSKFIRGGGFTDVAFSKLIVNRKGLRNDKLSREISIDYAKFQGFAIHINYNLLGEIVELTAVPISTTRLGCDNLGDFNGKIAIHPDWAKLNESKKFDIKDVDFIDVYNPSKVFEQIQNVGGIENYKGQIFWYSIDGFEYPKATFDSELESAETDIAIKDSTLNNVENNFAPTNLLVTGEAETEEERDEFKENIKQFSGTKAKKVFWVERKNKEDIVEIIKLEVQNLDKLYAHTEKTVGERIRRIFSIPPVLSGDLIAGKLGTAQEIIDAVAFYNAITYDDRLVIEETFTELFKRWNTTLNTVDFSLIPIKMI